MSATTSAATTRPAEEATGSRRGPLAELVGARRRAGARWSASFSLAATLEGGGTKAIDPGPAGANEEALRKQLWGATRLRYRWRVDGRQPSRSFKLPDELDAALEFRRTLTAAIVGDWPVDDRGQPRHPGTATPQAEIAPEAPVPSGAPGATVLSFASRQSPPALIPEPATGPGVVRPLRPAPTGSGIFQATAVDWADLDDEVSHLDDFEALVAWRATDLQRFKSRHGRDRVGSTLGNAETELGVAERFFRYVPGDPRLADPAVEAGAPLRFDHPSGITEADCLAVVDHRRSTNLSTRAKNVRDEQRWAKALEAAERQADRDRTEIVLPPAPVATAEVAQARTVEATCRTVSGALRQAHLEGRIETNPWTPRVDRLIETPVQPHFTDKVLPSPDQVSTIIDTVAAHSRQGPYVDGRRQVQDGGRYRAFVAVAEDGFLRPEELIAIRRSWLVLDGANPGVVVQGGEVNYPLRFTGGSSARTFVSLKARQQGDTRWVPISTVVAATLRDHLDAYVSEPDPTTSDRDRQDPRIFTTHTGAPIDLSTFAEKWWRPALSAAFPNPADEHVAGMPLRMLRHTGISRMLRAGHHYEDVATWAGNSPLVIKRHYRGVIDQQPAPPARHPHGARLGDSLHTLAAEVAGLGLVAAQATVARHLDGLDPLAAMALGRALHAHGKARSALEEP
jgi:integrase